MINKKECKRHRWRVGSGIGAIVKGKLETTGLNIWCEKCDKKLIAHYNSKVKLNFEFKPRR